jgi:hypothetical protein
MKFHEKCSSGDWRSQIFINPAIEEEFETHLNAVIELFNPSSEN